MNDEAFRALLDIFMCADPWPSHAPQQPLEDFLNKEAKAHGYETWIDAYHGFVPEEIAI